MFSQEAHCRGQQTGVLTGMGQDGKTHSLTGLINWLLITRTLDGMWEWGEETLMLQKEES